VTFSFFDFLLELAGNVNPIRTPWPVPTDTANQEPMPAYSKINVDLLTDTHRISCRLEAGNLGIVGVLNDINTSAFQVEDAYISRLQQPAKIIEHRPTVFIVKSTLSLALVARREEIGPQGLARGGYTQLMPFPVLMTTSAFEIRGTLELPGKLDVGALLTIGTGKYLLAYKVNVIATAQSDIPYTSEVLIINRNSIQVIAPDQGGKTGG
jgi:hypothetical protein